MSDDARAEIAADLRERARYYATLTAIGVPVVKTTAASPGVEAAPVSVATGLPAATGVPAATGLSAGAGHPSLAQIREEMGDCRRCKLSGGRKNIVFGQGNPKASLMFVGEAPGSDEDEQGLAFVGRAGQLLTDIIEKGLKIPRPEVFIANVIKCRPPQNRNPEPDEITSCQPFLEAQIRAIAPKVLVGLGKFAGQWLLKTAEPISRIRGRLADYGGIPVMPTWHPAYLLRNPAAKRDVWEDMKIVRGLLDRP